MRLRPYFTPPRRRIHRVTATEIIGILAREKVTSFGGAVDITAHLPLPAADGRVRWSAWLKSERLQVTCYRAEDNGDRSEWSMYNRGRAAALQAVIEDVTALLSNARSEPCPPPANQSLKYHE